MAHKGAICVIEYIDPAGKTLWLRLPASGKVEISRDGTAWISLAEYAETIATDPWEKQLFSNPSESFEEILQIPRAFRHRTFWLEYFGGALVLRNRHRDG